MCKTLEVQKGFVEYLEAAKSKKNAMYWTKQTQDPWDTDASRNMIGCKNLCSKSFLFGLIKHNNWINFSPDMKEKNFYWLKYVMVSDPGPSSLNCYF